MKGSGLGARGIAASALLWAALGACARPAPRPPAPPAGEELLFPFSRSEEVTEKEGARLDRAWRALQSGDLRRAERDYEGLLRKRPGLAPAEAGLASVRLRAGDKEEARRRFVAVLERRSDYLPALAGAAEASLGLGDPESALVFLRRAEAADPGSAYARRRLAEVKVQVLERRMAAARTAASTGDFDEAAAVYRRALTDAPELADLRLELANLLATRGERQEAVSVLEADTIDDRQVLLRLGEILVEGGEHERALMAYRRLLARDPRDEEARQRAEDVRHALELARMPEEYQRIATAATITRADLAALLAVKVTALSRLPAQTPPVAVDISGSWAREHILAVLAHDVLPVYPNHTFQPGATARRGDLARAVQRVLDLAGYPVAAAPTLTDMSRSHLYYYAASRVVAAGLMDLTPEGAFHAWRPPSGEEATQVLESLARLIGP